MSSDTERRRLRGGGIRFQAGQRQRHEASVVYHGRASLLQPLRRTRVREVAAAQADLRFGKTCSKFLYKKVALFGHLRARACVAASLITVQVKF